jgi:hypothetical protein
MMEQAGGFRNERRTAIGCLMEDQKPRSTRRGRLSSIGFLLRSEKTTFRWWANNAGIAFLYL